MNALVAELKKFSKENKITLKDLQSLVGSLNFFSKAVRSARAFNRRFYDLTVKAKKPHHFNYPNSDPNSLSLIFSQLASAKKWKID
jgi:hypothetical protein